MAKQLSSQLKRILHALQAGERVSQLEAVQRFGSLRLGARIYDLRAAGYNIETELVTRGRKTYAEYYMTSGRRGQTA